MTRLDTVQTARTALRAFFRIAEAWDLTLREQMLLLDVEEATCIAWRQGQVCETLPSQTLERLSCVLNVYAALHRLLPIKERADAWVRQPNTAAPFGGAPAINMLTSGQLEDLHSVVDYLATQQA